MNASGFKHGLSGCAGTAITLMVLCLFGTSNTDKAISATAVKAKAFFLVNSQDEPVGVWTVDNDGSVAFTMGKELRKPMIQLRTSAKGSLLHVFDENGDLAGSFGYLRESKQCTMNLGMNPAEGSVIVSNRDGGNILLGEHNRHSIMISNGKVQSVALQSQHGTLDMQNAPNLSAFSIDRPEASAMMNVSKLLAAYVVSGPADEHGQRQPVVFSGLDTKSSGYFHYNANGQTLWSQDASSPWLHTAPTPPSQSRP